MEQGGGRLVLRARERFFTVGPADLGVRPEIEASWRRSALSGVPADRIPEVPIEEEYDRECRLLRAATPVLDRLEQEIAGAPMSVILTDADARILDRRVGFPQLLAHLDRVLAVPGACYGEEVVGTSGLGSTVETRQPFVVSGGEHFSEVLHPLTCVGTPLAHPITGRVEGVLDLTCRHQDANSLMLTVVLDAAREIRERLFEAASRTERALLEHFLVARRRSSDPIISVNEDFIITNAPAARLLKPEDHALLWERAAAIVESGDACEAVSLSDGSVVLADVQRICHGGAVVGALIKLDRGTARSLATSVPRTASLPGLAGRTGSWRRACELVHRHARSTLGVAVLGEPGVGKLAVAKALHALGSVDLPLAVVDAALAVLDEAAWVRALREAVGRPGTVVLHHADLLSSSHAAVVAAVLEEAAPVRVVSTAGERWADEGPRALVDRFPAKVHLPPLRQRRDDVAALVEAFVGRAARGPNAAGFAAGALQALVRHDWPGNVRELEGVVALVLGQRPRGEVAVEDLPEEYRTRGRRRELSVMEQLELDAIVRVLQETSGNKHEAADRLGISRSTLYRKLKAYGIELDRIVF